MWRIELDRTRTMFLGLLVRSSGVLDLVSIYSTERSPRSDQMISEWCDAKVGLNHRSSMNGLVNESGVVQRLLSKMQEPSWPYASFASIHLSI